MKISMLQITQIKYSDKSFKTPASTAKAIAVKQDICIFTGQRATLENDKIFDESRQILKKFKTFSEKEYDKLSPGEIKKLRQTRSNYFLNNDLKQISFAYNILKKNLDRLYPNGYVFVSIGRSPSCFAKMLQAKGKEVKFCPSKCLQNWHIDFSKKYKEGYAEYLKSIGITKEIIEKSDKPFVFVDFTETGNSLANFHKLIKEDEIGISQSENVEFKSLNNELMEIEKTGIKGRIPILKLLQKSKISDFISVYLREMEIKKYSPVPHLDFDAEKSDIKSLINSHKESLKSKLFSFHIIDEIKKPKSFLRQLFR